MKAASDRSSQPYSLLENYSIGALIGRKVCEQEKDPQCVVLPRKH